ncbi:hypothetical protein EW146_g3311 [Bondarzewia mesenterica]|uniref:TAP42-like protein n=1 Tax=Bondarzewia mesenterica TaxID=1095465 RepID=A0A4S4LZT2_9AGAM|nr:hypothetical protein EW146_g3311 [Bondarzewia mesenterica]
MLAWKVKSQICLQELVASAQKDLQSVCKWVTELSLFSPNESLEDISTHNLIYLLVPFAISEVEGRIRATEIEERLPHLRESERNLFTFVSDLETYNIVPESERQLLGKRASSIADATKRRETKIKQYQKEKELRARIETIRKRRGARPSPSDESPNDFDLIASLLPTGLSSSSEQDDSETDDILREATLLLLRLTYAQSHAQLENISQELELLQNAPPFGPKISRGRVKISRGRESGLETRCDKEPLQPFTILPSSGSDRARLKSQVFQADHRLPTMSIDEYLEIEQQRGNIITGGGPASAAQPTSKEQLALDSEQDGTVFAEQKAEEKRQKDENWARFTDENPSGAGNTMNRG